jgi:hypothetical protein
MDWVVHKLIPLAMVDGAARPPRDIALCACSIHLTLATHTDSVLLHPRHLPSSFIVHSPPPIVPPQARNLEIPAHQSHVT